MYVNCQPLPVSARSKAWVCGSSLSGTAGWNPAGGTDACLFAKADHSSRGVVPSVMCMSVIVKPL